MSTSLVRVKWSLLIGMSQQNIHEMLISSVVKTRTSGRLRTLVQPLLSWSVDPDLVVEGGVGTFRTKRSGWVS